MNGSTAPEEMGDGGPMLPPEVETEVLDTAKEAGDTAKVTKETAGAAKKAAAEAKSAGTLEAAGKATDAALAAEKAAEKAEAAAAKADAAAAKARATVVPKSARFRDSGRFLLKGFYDFRQNIKRTWLIIAGFIVYLLASTTALYWFLKVPAQVHSWVQALHNTWLSMSTAGELGSKSSEFVWALGVLNLLVGLLFFGFIVWLVTTSLYQSPAKT
jgi:hypothetical protein